MAAESILKAQGPFEIDQASDSELFQIRALEGLWRNIRRKSSLAFFYYRQTSCVQRDAGADLHRRDGKICLYHQSRRWLMDPERRVTPRVFDQSCELGVICKFL